MRTLELRASPLDDATVGEILRRADVLTELDHGEALAEHARFGLRSTDGVLHVIERTEASLEGYGQLTLDPVKSSIEFLGSTPSQALFDKIIDVAHSQGLHPAIWLHGCSTQPVLSIPGYQLDREVLRLERPLRPLPPPDLPPGVKLRPFVVGKDEKQWLATNAASFQAHPEQGGWGPVELAERVSAPWFDPEGFLIMEVDHSMAGFCWTKVHRDPWGVSGEIYVIGIVPDVAGRKLGRLLVLAGLAHLSALGISHALLYVEADNSPARRLYEELGFEERWRDVRFARSR